MSVISIINFEDIDMSEPTVQQTIEAVAALREEITKNLPDPEKLDRINEFLDQQEEKNQTFLNSVNASKDREDEFKERIKTLELEVARGVPSIKGNHRELPAYKALESYIRRGKDDMSQEEKTLLRTDSDTAGGYLAPVEVDNVVVKKITETSPIRSIARVRTTSAKALEMAIRNTIPTATYEGQAETGVDSTSTYGNETLTPARLTFTTPITIDMLMNAFVDMDAEVLSDAGEGFAVGEGTGFVAGTGVKEPEGFLVNAVVVAAARESTTSSTVDPNDVILLTGDLKVGYDPVYVFNRTTLAFIRTYVSTTGQFLWQPGLNGPTANTLNGFPYVIAPDMPDIASNSLSIAFGDFRRGYTILDRTGLSIIRDEVTLKKQAIVEFTFHKWNTGQVILPEAIKLLKTKA